MKKVVFVCTANYYRSRFAQAWFNFTKGPALRHWWADSRGLRVGLAPASISPYTQETIKAHKIPKLCFQPSPVALTQEDLEEAKLVIALKHDEHYPMMQQQFPEWVDRIRYWEVHDLDVWKPEQTLPAIMIQVGLLIAELSEQGAA